MSEGYHVTALDGIASEPSIVQRDRCIGSPPSRNSGCPRLRIGGDRTADRARAERLEQERQEREIKAIRQ